ncbi:MAG: FapA family protein [Syntrophomonadaceae bacterium]|nr:FapA family protein [Syntrophomonadaceae bacterium]MDD3888629.1 FapA family protein [Syntrophomonadaceae bacterium]MDD4548252.1 FapA family protein [Syntrophomonadaceae bacterium]
MSEEYGNLDGKARVHISKDRLKAYIEVIAPSGTGRGCTLEKVQKALDKSNVVYGIIADNLNKALSDQNWGEKILVAEGRTAVDGTDARIIYKFPLPNERVSPRIDDKGKVNYYDLGLIYNVKMGELLVERIPGKEGIAGIDVTGREIPARRGTDFKLPRGKNTVSDENQLYLYATLDGHVSLINGKVSVDPVFTLNGDVDLSSGNIEFLGNIVITGNVNSNFKIKARGDIEIYGFVEGAEVIAEGSIMVRGGITGGVKGMVHAGENIYARFAENSRLEAGKDIIIREAIMQSYVKAGGSLKVTDKRATIVGGVTQATDLIEAKTIGSQLAPQTIVEVGVNPYYRDEYQQLLKKRTEKMKIIDNLNHNLQVYQKSGVHPEGLSDKKKIALIKMLDNYKTFRQDLSAIAERILFLENEFTKIKSARVKVHQIVYPGVRISIGQSIYIVNDPIKYSAFVLEEGDIRLSSLR